MKITFDPTDAQDVARVTSFFNTLSESQTAPSGAQIDPEATDPYSGSRPVDEVVTPPTEPTHAVIDAKAGVELDANGTPWIDGVHATTKSKKADGTWTKKRGTDDDVLRATEEKARAQISNTPDAPDMSPVEVEAETLPPVEMGELVKLYSEKNAAGLITAEGFGELYTLFETDPADLATNETARRQMFDHLTALVEPASLPGM